MKEEANVAGSSVERAKSRVEKKKRKADEAIAGSSGSHSRRKRRKAAASRRRLLIASTEARSSEDGPSSGRAKSVDTSGSRVDPEVHVNPEVISAPEATPGAMVVSVFPPSAAPGGNDTAAESVAGDARRPDMHVDMSQGCSSKVNRILHSMAGGVPSNMLSPLGDTIMGLAQREPHVTGGFFGHILPVIPTGDEDSTAVSPHFQEVPGGHFESGLFAEKNVDAEVEKEAEDNRVTSETDEVNIAADALTQLRNTEASRPAPAVIAEPAQGRRMGVFMASVGSNPKEFGIEEYNRLIAYSTRLGYGADYMIFGDGGPSAVNCYNTTEEIDVADQVGRSFCFPELEEELVAQPFPTLINNLDTMSFKVSTLS